MYCFATIQNVTDERQMTQYAKGATDSTVGQKATVDLFDVQTPNNLAIIEYISNRYDSLISKHHFRTL